MPKNALKIIPSSKKEETKRKKLLQVIQRKRIKLQELVVKTEDLRISLEMAKQEYMVKVGSLFLKDNHLEFEIIRYKNILKLMTDGMTYNQAVEEIAQTFYAEQVEFEREQQRIKHEEEIFHKRAEQLPELMQDIKKLWKKLIAKFHPDLTQDPQEKKDRDIVMKQINKAYQEGDYDQLMKIERENMAHEETSIDNLEEILLTVMNEIDEQIKTFKELRQSEWYGWMEKIERAKKKKENIFADTERALLNDIVAKYDVLNALKDQIKEKDKRAVL